MSLRPDCPSLGRMRYENGEYADRGRTQRQAKKGTDRVKTKQGLFKFKTTKLKNL